MKKYVIFHHLVQRDVSDILRYYTEEAGEHLADRFYAAFMHADQLVVAGFGCAEPDRAEFGAIIDQLPTFKSVKVINPNPSEYLLSTLAKVAEGEIVVSSSPL